MLNRHRVVSFITFQINLALTEHSAATRHREHLHSRFTPSTRFIFENLSCIIERSPGGEEKKIISRLAAFIKQKTAMKIPLFDGVGKIICGGLLIKPWREPSGSRVNDDETERQRQSTHLLCERFSLIAQVVTVDDHLVR